MRLHPAHDWTNGSNAKAMAPTSAQSSDHGTRSSYTTGLGFTIQAMSFNIDP